MSTNTKKVSVIAAAGLKVPREENARKYIEESAAVEVPLTPYYRRRLGAGELLRAGSVDQAAAAGAADLAKVAKKGF